MNLPPNASGRALSRFRDVFGRAPRWIAAAPGRVNVIGEHVDYNDGFVLPMAINRLTVVAADRAPSVSGSPRARLGSGQGQGEAVISLEGAPVRGEPAWADYVRGVTAGFLACGARIESFDAWIESDVPLGGGLSSSASLEVAWATLLEELSASPLCGGLKLSGVAKALLCQKAEHDFAGVPCGIMDQFIAAMGREGSLLLLDCRSHAVEQVPFADPALTMLIANSNVKHALTDGGYARRRDECHRAAKSLGIQSLRDATASMLAAAAGRMEPIVHQRARHVIGEIARTPECAAAFRAGDWRRAGALMNQSHDSLRDDFQVSCAELDTLVEIARGLGEAGGVYGARMTGGGFGGCTVTLIRTDREAEISHTLAAEYRRRTGIDATVFSSRPSAGARMLLVP